MTVFSLGWLKLSFRTTHASPARTSWSESQESYKASSPPVQNSQIIPPKAMPVGFRDKMMQRISSFLQTTTSPEGRAEQGSYFPETAANHERTQTEVRPIVNRRITVVRTDAEGLVPPTDKLLTFRSLTGIDNVPTLSSGGNSARAAPNVGIYPRVVQAENKAALRYKCFHIISNFCLGAQIVVGAALTALGAARGSHNAVTAFGAMNTIMAAILTYLKASGIPDRFKMHESQWKLVREHIEQRERELCLADCPLDPLEEVAIVEDMYNRVKAELDEHNNLGNRGFMGNQQATNNSSVRTAVRRAVAKVAPDALEAKTEGKSESSVKCECTEAEKSKSDV